MKIIVKESQGTNLWIPFPSCLVFNRFSAGFLAKTVNGKGVRMDKAQARVIIKALNRYRRKHRDWVLVEVLSADGNYVEIKL